MHPNPILARRFFSPVHQLPKELNEDPANLGIGRTASGGNKGMAVLEGYTAVLEVKFNFLKCSRYTDVLDRCLTLSMKHGHLFDRI